MQCIKPNNKQKSEDYIQGHGYNYERVQTIRTRPMHTKMVTHTTLEVNSSDRGCSTAILLTEKTQVSQHHRFKNLVPTKLDSSW